MARNNAGITPTSLEDYQTLTARLSGIALVLQPEDSDPPILAPQIRAATLHWLTEFAAAKELAAVGVKPRRTAIFGGPPGCGKTTLAHHIAARRGIPLVLADSQMIIGSYLGETGRNIAKLFDAIERETKGVVLLIDEFEVLGAKRVAGAQNAQREMSAIVVALLQRLDRFTGLFIAATNMPDTIDPALWRRFGLHLNIDLPDEDCRFSIIKRYLHPMQLPDEAVDLLANVTNGATPALLRAFSEGIKRDLVLAGRFEQPADAAAVIGRVVSTMTPSPELPIPPLWHAEGAKDAAPLIAAMAWPPSVIEKGKAA